MYNLIILVFLITAECFAERYYLNSSSEHCYCETSNGYFGLRIKCFDCEKLDALSYVWKKRAIHELTIHCTESSLDENVFLNASIERLIMHCPFDHFDENSFEVIPNLVQLSLILINFSKIPTAVSKLMYLRRLSLTNGQLLEIRNELQSMKYLEELDLSYNNIQTISGDAFINNRNIERFVFRHNNIRFFYPETFRFCSRIKYFFVDDNALETAHGLPIKDSYENLDTLDLQRNHFKTLPKNTLSKELFVKYIFLGENPWVCDCRILWLRQRFLEKRPISDPLICDQPEKFHGKRITELSEEDLIEWPNRCPSSCYCACVDENEGNLSIQIDCSARNLSGFPEDFPENVSQLDLQDNLLSNPVTLDSESLSNLRTLNLEKNYIKELDFVLPKTISTLFLANNSITRFFNTPPPNISQWTLAGNPWICDCKTIDFRKWMLSQTSKIADINTTRCGSDESSRKLKGKVIVLLSEADLCPSLVSTYVIITVSSLCIVLLAMGSRIMYYHYHYHMKVWLFSHGFTFLKKEVDQDKGKIYDAYVSSADEDFQIVRNFIIPELEAKSPNYTLFEPRRNMKAGELFEHEKEMEEILRSKRIIILLSRNYVKNNFLMEVFKFAFFSSLEEKMFRLILIMVEDLPPLSDVDQSLKAAVESTRCLRFGEKMFWDMLRFAMPKKQVHQRY